MYYLTNLSLYPTFELFPDSIDVTAETNICTPESYFNYFWFENTESDTSSISQPGCSSLIDHKISPIGLPLMSNFSGSSALEFAIYHNVIHQMQEYYYTGDANRLNQPKINKAISKISTISADIVYTKCRQKRSCTESSCSESKLEKPGKIQHPPIDENKKESNRTLVKKTKDRLFQKEYRAYIRNEIEAMESTLNNADLSLTKEHSEQVKFNNGKINKLATSYLLHNQSNHPLVKKYGVNELAGFFYGAAKPKFTEFPKSELKDLKSLKRKVSYSISARKSRTKRFNFIQQLYSQKCKSQL